MIEKGSILTGDDAEVLSQVLEKIIMKVDAESEANLDEGQALDALVSRFRNEAKPGQEKRRLKHILTLQINASSSAR
jgi:hypothetical protein